jgi:antitoxin MazE
MKPVRVSIRRIGNSQGVVIPKPVLAQLGLSSEAARRGWAEAARKIAEASDDALVMGSLGNATDKDLVW